MELLESRIYTFVDSTKRFAFYFLEGQQLIQELALIHPLQGGGFAYFRDVVLSFMPMLALLKHGEQLGLYLDAEDPYLRVKLEITAGGHVRCLLMPEDLKEFPERITGIVRVRKSFQNAKEPYNSIIEVNGVSLRNIINQVLERSYQFNSLVRISQNSDQSYLVLQLPGLPGDTEIDHSSEALLHCDELYGPRLADLMNRGLQQPEELAFYFQELQFQPMGARTVQYHCNCSQERMLANLQSLYINEGEALFEPGQAHLEVTCEYCKSRFEIARTEIEAISPLYN